MTSNEVEVVVLLKPFPRRVVLIAPLLPLFQLTAGGKPLDDDHDLDGSSCPSGGSISLLFESWLGLEQQLPSTSSDEFVNAVPCGTRSRASRRPGIGFFLN